MGVLGLRAASPDALARRIALVEAAGLGEGWVDGDRRRDPDGHRFELYYECERYEPPPHLRPALKNVPRRYTGRGCAVKRLDHVNVLAADVRASRDSASTRSATACTSGASSMTAARRAPG
jgi:catechol 2,3-dioxygenase